MKKLVLVCFILSMILSVFGIMYYLNTKSEEKDRQKINLVLTKMIDDNHFGIIDKVDLSLITMSKWDRFYIFQPYTVPEKIDNVLGKFWIGARFSDIKSSDQINLLVFTNKTKVVQFLEFPRSAGDFAFAVNDSGYSILESQFVADENKRMVWLFAKE